MVYSMQSPERIAADIGALRTPIVLADESDWTHELRAALARLGAVGIALTDGTHGALAGIVDRGRLGRGPFAGPTPGVGIELLSSGTTGPPKRTSLSWSAIELAVADAKLAYAGSEDRQAPALMVHPLGNIAGLAYIAPPVVYGQRIVLLEKFAAQEWAEAVRVYRPTRTALPPAALQMVLDAAIPRSALQSLSLLAVGGAKLDVELHSRFEATYGIPVLTAYGATEFGGVVANWTLPLYRQFGPAKRGSVGRPIGNVTLRIVDPDTATALPPGGIGLLEARVPRIGEHWIRTTDLACLDADGFLYLHGRADAAINRGGFKVLPEEVAAVLKGHPAVADAVVVGRPDTRLGEVPVAAVELRGDTAISAAELERFARSRLVSYQVPVEIRVLGALPRNASMKVSLAAVRTLFETAPNTAADR